MKNVVLILIKTQDRYLLIQHLNGMWSFINQEINSQSSEQEILQNLLYTQLGISYDGCFHKLTNIIFNEYDITIFLCDSSLENPHSIANDLIGFGWFTMPEMYSLKDGLFPCIYKILPQLYFLMRHGKG